MSWWEEENIDEEGHLAYFETFCTDSAGQKVLCHLQTLCFNNEAISAEAKLALIDLYYKIRGNCGIQDELAVIEAESEIARSFEPTPPTKPTGPDVYPE